MIEHATRRTDDDVNTIAQRLDLLSDRRATVDSLDEDAAVLADLRQLACNLQRELARRCEDQRLRLAVRSAADRTRSSCPCRYATGRAGPCPH
jgi:glutamate-1-semialdehyde aminotransferase